MKDAIFSLLMFFVLIDSVALGSQDDNTWQQKAVEKYPQLAVKDSEFNKRFLDAYNQQKKTNPGFFNNPRWPLLLADDIAASDQSGSQTPNSQEGSPSSTAIIGSIVGVGILIVVLRSAKKARILSGARKYIAQANRDRALPIVTTDVILKAKENAFYASPAILYETRAVRQYESGSVGFRVAKGIYIGKTRGRSFSTQEWSSVDRGKLVITNKRLLFAGKTVDRSISISKVVHIHPMKDGIEIFADGRQKSMAFSTTNSLIVASIIRICAQADNPLDLSNTHLDFHFNG